MAFQKQLFKQQVVPGAPLILKNPQTSVNQSLEFTKQLTVVAVSCISYLRNIFPESAFTERKLNGVPVRIIKGDEDIPGTQKLITWLKCALSAVQLHILKKMILVIQKHKSDETLEIYTFNFVYNQDEISCQVRNEEGHTVSLESKTQEIPADIMKSVQKFVRSILILTTTLQPLPDGCELTMKLEFNDEVPDDYDLPECFTPVESLGIHFPDDIISMKLGKVETRFTTVALTTKSVCNQAEDNAEENPNDEHMQSISYASPEHFTDIREGTNSAEAIALTQRLSTSLALKEREIYCICELNDCNDAIQCVSCLKFQHRACYRLLEHLQVSRHICVNCHDPSDISKMCTDSDLINNNKLKEAAVYRRALLLCLSNDRVSSKTFQDQLGVTRYKAQQLINRLDIDGCLCPASGKGALRTVKTDHLKDNVLACNFKVTSCDDIINMNIENNINTSNINKRKRLFYQEEDSDECNEPKHRKKQAKHLKYYIAQSPNLIN